MGSIFTLLTYFTPRFLYRQRVEYPDSLDDVCKENICKLDESVVKHLRSLDAMRATADMLYTLLNDSPGGTAGNGPLDASQNTRKCRIIAARLLISIENIVCDDKQEMVSSIRSFLTFVMYNADRLSKSDAVKSISLKIDEYETDPNVVQLTENDVIKQLHSEKDTLMTKNAEQSSNIMALQSELNELKGRLEDCNNKLKNRDEHVQNEVTKLKKLNNDLKQSKESQAKELQEKTSSMKKIEKEKIALQKQIDSFGSEHSKKQQQKEKRMHELEEEIKELKEEINRKDLELTEINIKAQSLAQGMQKKENDIAELKSKTESATRDMESQRQEYENKLKEQEKSICKLQQEIEEVNSFNESLKEIITTKGQDIKVKEESLAKLSQQNKHLQKTMEAGKKDMETQRRMYESKLVGKEKNISDLTKSNREKDQVIETYQLDKIVMTEENKKLITKANELLESFNETKKELASCQQKIEQQNVEIEKLARNLKESETIVHDLQEENIRKDQRLQQLQNEFDEQKVEIETLENRCQAVTAELTEINSIKTIPVQLYCQQKTQWTSSLESQIIDLMKTEIQSVDSKVEFNIYKISRPSDIRPEIPLVLICVTISRLGTDVINATDGLTLTSNTAVVVFHHKDEHALPNQASERVLTGKEMRGSGGIYDMAFKSDRGIYMCDFNTKAVESLVTFIRRQII